MPPPSGRTSKKKEKNDGALDCDAWRLHEALSELVRAYQFRDRKRVCYRDISVTQCHAINALILHGSLQLNRLAAELFLDKSTASRVVDSLEKKGYVRRSVDPSDGRALRLTVTGRGRALFSQIEQNLVDGIKELIADFDPDVRKATADLIGRLGRAASVRFSKKPDPVRRAGPGDVPQAERLLRLCNLPTEGIGGFSGEFFSVAEQNGRIVGLGGMEVCGAIGLLRSVVVAPGCRGKAVGRALVEDRLDWAEKQGLTDVYLLTVTADDYFERFGFVSVDRGSVPSEIKRTAEFSSICPSTATVMRLRPGRRLR
jgi:MarR family transcriptional regulator, 2-MHQ and catechol-resistance regulon repressor